MKDQSKQADDFTHLYEECQQRLFVYISMFVPHSIDARDILQDVNLILWQKFDQYEPGTNFYAWAHEIARYRILRYRQVRSKEAVPVDMKILETSLQQKSGADGRQVEIRRRALAECIEKLKPKDKTMILERYTPGISVREMASKNNRSENAISQSLRRIRKILQRCVSLSLDRVSDRLSTEGGIWDGE